jgi:hypothetical protein
MITRQMLSAVSSGRMPAWRLTRRRIISASRAGRNALPDSWVCFTAIRRSMISPIDDLAARHEQPVHGLIDPVDLLAQIRQRRCGGGWNGAHVEDIARANRRAD